MQPLAPKVAEILYDADVQPVDWAHADPVDRAYYSRVADIVVDTVIDHLKAMEIPTDAICEYLQTEADITRLRREALHG